MRSAQCAECRGAVDVSLTTSRTSRTMVPARRPQGLTGFFSALGHVMDRVAADPGPC